MNASDHVTMMNQYADSDSPVKSAAAAQFRIAAEECAMVHEVADDPQAKELEPVSEFIRFLIDRWSADGKLLKDLAQSAGLAKSMPSQIKARTSDATMYSARKLAKPLGYKDLPDLVNAAWRWWHSKDRAVAPPSAAEAPQAEALRIAEQYGVTKGQIVRVLERFPLAEFPHQDALWWLSKFHEARTEDAERQAARRAAEHVEAGAERMRSEIRATKAELEAAARGPRSGSVARSGYSTQPRRRRA